VSEHLRPIERCVLAMRAEGLSVAEIGSRIKRSAEHVERIIDWSSLPQRRRPPRRSARAFERRVLALRARGESYETIGRRFNRSGGFIRRVEGLAHYRKAVELLG
jgi:DNA-binding CsgD family transcriptional regulator